MQLSRSLFKPLALSLFLLGALQTPGGLPITAVAHATTTESVNSRLLLSGLHRSLATIVVAYIQKSPAQRSRPDALMLDGARETTAELAALKSAIADRDARRISTAVRKMSQAIGRLQGMYRMAAVRNPTVAEGMRALSANWAAFTAYYALPPSNRTAKSVTQGQLNELKDRVSTLERQLRARRAQASSTPVVLREVEYAYVEVERINRRPLTIETYQSTLLSLSFLSGTMSGYVSVSAVYFPQFHDYWVEEVERSSFYEGYWDGYYQGYYDGLADGFFEASYAAPPELVTVNVDESINEQVDVYVTQEINVLVVQAQDSAVEFSDLPINATDVAGDSTPITIDNPIAAAEKMTEGALWGIEPDAETDTSSTTSNPSALNEAATGERNRSDENGAANPSDDRRSENGVEVQQSVPSAPASSDMQQSPDDWEEREEPRSEKHQPALQERPSEYESNDGVPPQQKIKPEHQTERTDGANDSDDSDDVDARRRRHW